MTNPTRSIFVALLLVVPLPSLAGDVAGGERDPEEGGGTSPAVYHLQQDQTTFETTIATELGNGNKLVDIEVLFSPGPPAATTFSGVFYPVTGTIHELIHGTQFQWDTFLTTVGALDGRWLDIEVVSQTGVDRSYSAIFLEDGDDYGYVVDSDMSDADLQTKMEANLRQDFQLVDFEAYTIPATGATRFAAIWVRDPNQPMTHLYYDLEIGDVADLWSPLAGRILDFERYHSQFFGEERFALLLANHPGGDWWADTYMEEADLDTANMNESDADTHLIDLHVFDDGSGIRYSGVWGENWKSLNEVAQLPAENTVSLTADLNNLITNFEVVSPNGEGIVGFYAKNLRTGQSVGYRKDEPFYIASATKTAVHIRLWQQIEAGHFAADENTMMFYTNAANTGAPWYMDERGTPGFASGSPGRNDDLGMQFSLDRFDEGMMQVSDNATTSALVDHPGLGLSWDETNLNEWLSSVDGVSRGWGIVTSIQDIDRLVLWQSQHTEDLKDNDSYFLAPGHTLRPRLGSPYQACVVNGQDEPQTCPTPSDCTRCNGTTCGPTETCRRLEDPWGDLRAFFGMPSSGILPGCLDVNCQAEDLDRNTGRRRYFNTGLNSATPRAFSNLLEKFWNNEFFTTPASETRDTALGNMLGSNPPGTGGLNTYQLANALCRYDTDGDGNCDPRDGYTLMAVKGGQRGNTNDTPPTQVCTDTGMLRMDDTSEVFTLLWFTRDGGVACTVNQGTNDDLRDFWAAQFGEAMLQAIAVDLVPAGGSFTPTTAGQLGTINVDIQVDNVGGGISPAFDVDVYASTDQTIDSGDVLLGRIRAGGPTGFGSVQVAGFPIQISGQLAPGDYYVGMIVDTTGAPAGEAPELDETAASNNGLLTTQQLTVLPPCPDNDADGFAACDAGCSSTGQTCGDCDDSAAFRYPGAPEQCNGIDDDCDTVVDNGIPTPVYALRLEHEDPQPTDRFGSDVANVGDVDGDGKDDLAIGMRGEDTGAAFGQEGIVRVVSGADFSTICEAQLPTPATNDALGFSVAAAGGDLNGSGTADFVTGFPYHDSPGDSGAVAAFNLPDCAFIRLMKDPLVGFNAQLGAAVASIGDVNNDGVPDIAAGARLSSLGGSQRGSVSVFSGADGSVLYTAFDTTGVANDFGRSLTAVGDVTGDGVPDLVTGAPETNTGAGSDAGALYVISGVDGSIHAQWIDPGGDFAADLGLEVAAIGDLNADGITEVAASAPDDIVGSVRSGSVSIFDGATGAHLQRLYDPVQDVSSYFFGSAIAPIADINGDGFSDVAVGARFDNHLGTTDSGSVLLFNPVNGALLHHLSTPSPRVGDELGSALVSLGDLSGDGFDELAAAAHPADHPEGADAGFVLIFSLEEDCDADGHSDYAGDCDDANTAISPDAVESCDGVDNDCNGLIDEDGDGDGFDVCTDCDDLDGRIHPGAVEICNGRDDDCNTFVDDGPDGDGDSWSSPCDCDDNAALVFPSQADTCDHVDNDCSGIPDDGAAMLVSTRVSELPGGLASDWLGYDVDSVGDVNFDGVDDYVAGVPKSDLTGTNRGAAVVFDGASGAVHCIATPESQDLSESGQAVAGIGDVDGDGAGDFAMAAPWHDGAAADSGKVYVVSGDDCTTIRELDDPGGQFQDRLGTAVAGLDDLTGDGVREIAAGAPFSDGVSNNSGLVIVWDGATGAELFRSVDSSSGGNRVGDSLAAIGDVNADGTPDFLAGAPADFGLLGGDIGSVLIFSGADGSVIRKLFDPNASVLDALGTAVAGIDDLDGDAVPDVLAGTISEDSGGGNNGAILVFSGADGSLLQRVFITTGMANLNFGTAVAALPDLNGDGIADFAGGAPGDDSEATDAGRVLVVSGADFSVLHDLTLPGSSAGANLGAALAAIGDVSGDGYPELLVGQPFQDTLGNIDVGRAVVFGFESDCDVDGVGPFGSDCDDADPDSQSAPSAARELRFDNKTDLAWLPPANGGGGPSTIVYDLVRSDDPGDFVTTSVCVETDDGTDTAAMDTDEPPVNTMYTYLVRVENRCGEAIEPDNSGASRDVADCP